MKKDDKKIDIKADTIKDNKDNSKKNIVQSMKN